MGIRDINANLLAEDIFAELWPSRVVDSGVLIPALDSNTATGYANMLVWFPYKRVGKCTHVKDTVLQNRWILDSNNTGHFIHNTSAFPQKISRDLHGCPLTVSRFELPLFIMRKNTTEVDPQNTVHDKGLELQILREVANSKNSSLKFRLKMWVGPRERNVERFDRRDCPEVFRYQCSSSVVPVSLRERNGVPETPPYR